MSALRPFICKSMTEEVLSSLRREHINTVTDFVTRDCEDIAQQCGIAFKDAVSIRRVLLAQYSAFPVSAAQLFTSAVASQAIFSSGIASLDELLEGGFYAGEVYELTGETASGKSQVCMWAVGTVARLHGQKTVFIDTCGSGCVETWLHSTSLDSGSQQDCSQVPQLAEAALSRIRCVQVHDVYSLLSAVEEVRSSLQTQSEGPHGCVKLVAIDCVTATFSPLQGGQQINSWALVEQLGQQLRALAVEHSVAVVVTNNLVCGADGHHRPALGRVWSHAPHTRLLLEKIPTLPSHSSVRKATVVKSVRLATLSSAQFDLAPVSGGSTP